MPPFPVRRATGMLLARSRGDECRVEVKSGYLQTTRMSVLARCLGLVAADQQSGWLVVIGSSLGPDGPLFGLL